MSKANNRNAIKGFLVKINTKITTNTTNRINIHSLILIFFIMQFPLKNVIYQIMINRYQKSIWDIF